MASFSGASPPYNSWFVRHCEKRHTKGEITLTAACSNPGSERLSVPRELDACSLCPAGRHIVPTASAWPTKGWISFKTRYLELSDAFLSSSFVITGHGHQSTTSQQTGTRLGRPSTLIDGVPARYRRGIPIEHVFVQI